MEISEILLSTFFILILITILGVFISLIVFLPKSKIFTNIMFFIIFVPVSWSALKIFRHWIIGTLRNIKFINFYLSNFKFLYWGLKILLYLIALLIIVYFIIRLKKNFVEEFIKFFSPLPYVYFLTFIVSLFVILPRIFISEHSSQKHEEIHENPDNSPNIIFIIFDALSAEHMSLYGYKKKTTPFIEELAKTSYVFKSLITVSNYTSTSVMSIYSSLYPTSHRVYAFYQFPIKEVIEEKNIFKFFHDKGYKIFTIIQNPLVPIYSFKLHKYSNYVFFSDFIKYPIHFLTYISSMLGYKFKVNVFHPVFIFLKDLFRDERTGLYFLSFLRKTPFPIDRAFDEGLKIIKKEKGPLFILMHLFCPHDPFLPPGIEISSKFDNSFKQFKYLYRSHPVKDSSDIKILEDLYDENIKYADRELKKFVEKLKEMKKFKNTVFVITSDHGESFIPAYVGHNTPYFYTNELIRVPLIIKFPDSGHKYIEKNGSIVDIFPTLLDLLKFEKPDWIEGKSLLDSIENDFLYSGFFQEESRFYPGLKNSTLCIIKDSFKFYYNMETKEYSLYDFINDPYDKKDISAFYPDKVEEFIELIMKRFYN